MGFVPDLLSYARTHAPNHPAAVAGERSLTLRSWMSGPVAWFGCSATCPWSRDVVALLAKNEAEYFELHIAAIRAGLVLLPLNLPARPPELEYIVADARPEC